MERGGLFGADDASTPPRASGRSPAPAARTPRPDALRDLLLLLAEIRHAPLARMLQASPKFVGTAAWSTAREEARAAHAIERYVDLRRAGGWLGSGTGGGIASPVDAALVAALHEPAEDVWGAVLSEARERHEAMSLEARWRKQVAHTIAHQCAAVVRGRFSARDAPRDTSYFYNPEFLAPAPPEQHQAYNYGALPAGELRFLASTGLSPTSCGRALAHALNTLFHCGKCVRRADFFGARAESHEKTDGTAQRHWERTGLMRGAATRLVSASAPAGGSRARQRLGISVHPSHEAAARKANMSISKLVTPMDLALRRMQRQTEARPGVQPPIPGRPLGLQASPVRPIARPVPQQVPRPQASPAPGAYAQHAQRQALLNRSAQIGSYLAATMATQQQLQMLHQMQAGGFGATGFVVPTGAPGQMLPGTMRPPGPPSDASRSAPSSPTRADSGRQSDSRSDSPRRSPPKRPRT